MPRNWKLSARRLNILMRIKNNISGFMFRNVESAVFANIAGGFFSVRA